MKKIKNHIGQTAPQLTPELRKLYRRNNKYLTQQQRRVWNLAMQRRMPQAAIARRLKKSQPWVSYTVKKIIWAVQEGVPTKLYRRAGNKHLKLTASQIERRWNKVTRKFLKMVKDRYIKSRTTVDISHVEGIPQPEVQAITSFAHRIISS